MPLSLFLPNFHVSDYFAELDWERRENQNKRYNPIRQLCKLCKLLGFNHELNRSVKFLFLFIA